MGPLATLAVAVGLGMDAMSVCLGIGVRWHGRRQKFRLAWHMGLFQFFMPLLGWLAGAELAGLLATVGKYVAAVLVAGVGAKMFLEAARSHPGAVAEAEAKALHLKDPTRGWSLIALSLATSIDALVVGFSVGVRGQSILLASVAIGLVAAAMALAGVTLGRRAGQAFGRKAELVGAGILVLLGASFAMT